MSVSSANRISASALVLAVALAFGCASPNVNPPMPKAGVAYVDFYAPSEPDLSWDIQEVQPDGSKPKSLFSSFDPVPGGIVRVALPPGRHRLRITFRNRVISEPAVLELEAPAGLVTPVELTLTPSGATSVQTKEYRPGPTYRGRYGRGTTFSSYDAQSYRASAAAQPPRPYQIKEKMPYQAREARIQP